ncbi:MAG TPA: SAV_6107 family HEPN domain-containing protein [Propionicimonas sp.]|nr:SAV_6107 family HEPN domain-containing protein [Propionicimonas sp.]HRA06052.1 SAV_6107 family HEPN domain-containing protein [Propionicimonas sp.]
MSGAGAPAEALAAARAALVAADLADVASERYLQAQLAALRIAAAVLAARAHRASGPRLRNVWQVVAEVAPEFAEWAGYFATSQMKRQAVAAGATALVSVRDADDLLRDAWTFHEEVARRLRAARTRGAQLPRTAG